MRLHRPVLAVLPLLLVTLSTPQPAAGQEPAPTQTSGSVAGRALDADGRPLAYALVHLLAGDTAQVGRTLTRADGAFRFDAVAPGRYRLQLSRIGFQSVRSPELEVAAGRETVQEIRGAMAPIQILGVTGAAACYTGDRLGRDRELAALWEEVRKGVETRRAFERQYRYSFDLRQHTRMRVKGLIVTSTAHDSTVTTVTAGPEYAAREDERRRQRRRRGYARGDHGDLLLDVPDERELVEADFLRTHCLSSGFEQVDGAWEFDFRPVRLRGRRIDVRGTIAVDARTFEVRHIRYEYLRGRTPFLTATIRYGDFAVPGGSLRLPASAAFSGGQPPMRNTPIQSLEGTLTFENYRDLHVAAQ